MYKVLGRTSRVKGHRVVIASFFNISRAQLIEY
jgi:hypothetical protein